MKRILTVAAASLMVVVAVGPAAAAEVSEFEAGPSGGDASTYTQADPASGEVVIFQRNTRQAAAVHCIGEGPRATLVATDTVSEAVSVVAVEYAEAFMSEHPVIDVLVTGSESGWLGHGATHGPKVGESGTVEIALPEPPQPGEEVKVTFGLQLHAGCLGHPTLLGAQGSRLVEGGRVVFTSVSIG
ncbi:MAG: hypothetical protein ACRDY7_01070 [Acidimicrobiia bacterium]